MDFVMKPAQTSYQGSFHQVILRQILQILHDPKYLIVWEL